MAEGDAAAERAEASWQAHAAGRELVAGSTARPVPLVTRTSRATTARAIRDWQGAVLDLVADEGMGKRSKARFLALGVNGVGVALMIVVFAHTGGLVGAEVGVAGGTAVLAQRVLEAVFGDQAVRRLAETAKEELDSRVQTLLSGELLRYHARAGRAWRVDGRTRPTRIRRAAAAVQAARADGSAHGTGLTPEEPALAGAPSTPAIEPPAVTQVRRPGVDDAEIVDAELVEPRGEPTAEERRG